MGQHRIDYMRRAKERSLQESAKPDRTRNGEDGIGIQIRRLDVKRKTMEKRDVILRETILSDKEQIRLYDIRCYQKRKGLDNRRT